MRYICCLMANYLRRGRRCPTSSMVTVISYVCSTKRVFFITEQMCTCTLRLVRPVPAVVLSIALPPRWNTTSIPTLILEIPGAARDLSGRSCNQQSRGQHQKLLLHRSVPFSTLTNHQESSSDVQWCCLFNVCIPQSSKHLWGHGFLLTAVGLVRVVPAVVHAVALPLQAHTHSVGTLEGVGVTHFPKLRWRGWRETHKR